MVFPIVFTIECGMSDKFEDMVQSLSSMCLYDVCSFILTEPHTIQT
jgi:hypothetical protein